MPGPEAAIATYIAAKDGNRPWLMRRAFVPEATLTIEVKSEAIFFPPAVSGLDAITETVIRSFGREYENVYTFCLGSPPDAETYSCDWLVGMSRRDNGELRVGFGQYDWSFAPGTPALATRLAITIEVMEVLPPETLVPVMEWLGALPYPWCPVELAAAGIPRLDALSTIADRLRQA